MDKTIEMKKVFDRLSSNNQTFDFHTPVEMNADLKEYLNYYDFNHEKIAFHFGKVEIGKAKVIVQMFAPKSSKGTVILLHGYLDHVGHLRHIINFLNEHQYTVVSYDLQGHGLSDGDAASINKFEDYVLTLETLMEKVKEELDGPFYAIGHSTGGAILSNYALKHVNHSFEKVIFVAPLVRSNFWYLTKIGIYLMKAVPFIQRVKRNFRKNSSSHQYLDFVRSDPLQPDVIPLDWTDALIEWNEKIQSYRPVHTKTCIIQGTDDETVDWKYNIKFLTESFPDSKVVYIENGKHALFNESRPIRELVCSFIHQFINE
ncbi:alpha/beta hydrolase [Aquibacillus albus]|uniref:Lysophospholipase n=1 Tax=Aquibacillus albus TaxID=1168171 RepID=A0ABS2MYB7_9BACI|nr:alpha/beta hydrolase [Aquibacillus albus]MBM7570882.1 lysophospholipase [Aquibacillus albus]